MGSAPKSVVVGDFTGDGREDAVLGTGWSGDPVNDNKLFLFAQTASGALSPAIPLATSAAGSRDFDEEMGMAAGDLDGDGRTDLVLATFAGVDVFLQRNGGLVRTGPVDAAQAEQVSLADLDGDADLDLVVDRRTGISTLTNTGTGSFGPPADVVDINLREIETADVTGDGRVDITGIAGSVMSVVARRADGAYAAPVNHALLDSGKALAVGDFNGDGRTDVAASSGFSYETAWVQVFLQAASGGLTEADPVDADEVPDALVATDMNVDGRSDLVTVHARSQAAGVFTQEQDGTLGTEQLVLVLSAGSYAPKALAAGDVSGDGFPDLVVADGNNGLVVVR